MKIEEVTILNYSAVLWANPDKVVEIAKAVPDMVFEIAKLRIHEAVDIAKAMPNKAVEIAKAVPDRVAEIAAYLERPDKETAIRDAFTLADSKTLTR